MKVPALVLALALGVATAAEDKEQGSQRIGYMFTQVPIATALYGGGIPWALDAGSVKAKVASYFLAAPVAFGAHLWFSQSRPFTQAHRLGTSYLSVMSLYTGFALPASLIDSRDTRWQVAAWSSMALYPIGVYGGYLLGDAYQAEPERIRTQANYALGFGLLGFFTPLLYFEDFGAHREAMWRIGLAQSVGLAGIGHFISRYQQSGPEAAGGAKLGLANHTALGMAAGLLTAAWADASSFRPWAGGAIVGGTLGFMEGLWFFHDSRDTRERGVFTMLGGGVGGLAGVGLTVLFWPDGSGYSQRVTAASLLAGGAYLGYAATYLLTRGMQESHAVGKRPGSSASLAAAEKTPAGWSWSFQPVPLVTPEITAAREAMPGQEKVSWRYSIPGLVARF